MPETNQVTFSHEEIVEMLIKRQDIHDGFWSIVIQFGLGVGALPTPPSGKVVPSAIVQIAKIGIQRSDNPNPGTIDAAKVNPPTNTEH